jgi:glutamate-5-semialdehyde dehydrogenase
MGGMPRRHAREAGERHDESELLSDDGKILGWMTKRVTMTTTTQHGTAGTVEPLTTLEPGTRLLVGGDRLARVPDEIAERFRPGDRLLVLQNTGEVLHVPRAEWEIAAAAVVRAAGAFERMGEVADTQIDRFYDGFAAALADDTTWRAIAEANAADVERARSRGRSTTRLVAGEKMRAAMIQGLHEWRDMPPLRGRVVEMIIHDGWKVEQVVSGYGVVGFVFEGRPNVFADGTGVLRSGNTTVLRIGSDALGTAQAIVKHALDPALAEAGLPEGAVTLVESAAHAAGWAMFSHPKLGLAVARGSGPAVEQLGSIARQAGIPVSLHGTGGAWIIADTTADAARFRAAVYHSIDRKVCNTLNVVSIPEARAADLVPALLDALRERGDRLGYGFKLHVVEGSERYVPAELFRTHARMLRAEGEVEETIADRVPEEALGKEWLWEGTPEVTLVIVADRGWSVSGPPADALAQAVRAFNTRSPRLVASLISEDPTARARFFATIDAPFVGDGFTRWVDGQYALNRPELGLSNWQSGRLFGRSGILTGDGVYTLRMRMTQTDPNVHR